MMKEQSTKTTRPQLQKSRLRTPEEYAKAEAQIREILNKAMPNSDPNFKGLIGELGDSGYLSLCIAAKSKTKESDD